MSPAVPSASPSAPGATARFAGWFQLLLTVLVATGASAAAPVQLDHDFRLGDHGWTGFFADHPPGVESDWGFESGLRPLPPELNLAGTGFLLAGNNHSDDLAMLMKKPLGPADGIVPGQTYRVSFIVDFASNAPDGAFGVGGSPGNSVYLKAGASTNEPLPRLREGADLHYRPTVNVGLQSFGGPAASVVDVIANGRDASLPATYVPLRREHSHPFLVSADAEGRLWLLVLTDSAFEGPTALYFQRIRVSLTPVTVGGDTRLINLAGRGAARPGEGALVAGVVVESPGARLLVRGVGPTLANFGVTPALPDPVLRLFDADGTLLAVNDDWGQAPDPAALAAATSAVGAFKLPAGSRDAALVLDLPGGAYTAVLEDAAGASGIALAEVYEVTQSDAAGGRLLNLSVRASLGRDGAGIFPGLVVRGPNPERFLIRAVGPRLADFGVGKPAVDPVLELYQGEELLAANDQWDFINDAAEVAAAAEAVGAFPLRPGGADAALAVTLDPGLYTLKATEADPAADGVALLEVYRLPSP